MNNYNDRDSDVIKKIKSLLKEIEKLTPQQAWELYQKAMTNIPEGTCSKCHGFIPIKGRAYGYAGKVCYCEHKK